MKIKYLAFIFLVVNFSASAIAQKEEKELMKSFFEDMQEMEDLNKYVYNSEGYTIDFFLVDEYKINEYESDILSVDLNTGGGEWTRLYFDFISFKEKLYIKGRVSEDRAIITPWHKKNKICPPD